MADQPDTSNNTPSETGPQAHATGIGGEGIKSWANSLATQLDITPAQATTLITNYIGEHGGTPQEAAVYLANHAPTGPGGGGDGSGSGSGGSAPRWGSGAFGEQSKAQAMANTAAGFINLLVSWGIQITPEVHSFVNGAVNRNTSTALFLQTVRATKFYAQRFKGIMRPNGTMRMTEAQYMAGYEQARDTAQSLGRTFSKQAYALAIQNGNSPSEIRDKLTAVDTLKQYGPMFSDFSDYLIATGVIKKPLTRAETQKFIMGESPKQFYDAYRTAQAAASVEELGFSVGQGGDIGYKDLAKVARQIEVMGQQGDWAGLLASASTVVNQGEFYGMGITQKDKVRLALGAPGARESAAKLQRAVNIKLAAFEQRANPDIIASQTGTQILGGPPQTQATE